GSAADGLPCREYRGACKDAVTASPGSTAQVRDKGKGDLGAGEKEELTGVGFVLTLLTVALIFAVAVPIVRWRDPQTGQPLPRMAAIISPVLIGAVVQGIGSLLLRCLGLPVWSKREKEN